MDILQVLRRSIKAQKHLQFLREAFDKACVCSTSLTCSLASTRAMTLRGLLQLAAT